MLILKKFVRSGVWKKTRRVIVLLNFPISVVTCSQTYSLKFDQVQSFFQWYYTHYFATANEEKSLVRTHTLFKHVTFTLRNRQSELDNTSTKSLIEDSLSLTVFTKSVVVIFCRKKL